MVLPISGTGRFLLSAVLVLLLYFFIGIDNLYAGSKSKESVAGSYGESCSYNHSGLVGQINTGFAYYFVDTTTYVDGNPDSISYKCRTVMHYWNPQDITEDMFANNIVYNITYTDDQCQARFGGNHDYKNTTVDPVTGARIAGLGACGAFATGVAVCTDDGVCYAYWEAVSTGNEMPSELDTGTSDIPDYLTETDDPDSCSSGSVAYDGQNYCYTGTAGNISESHFDDQGNPITDDGGDDGSIGSGGGDSGGGDGSSGGDGGSGGSDGGGTGVGGGGTDGDGSGGTGDGTGEDDGSDPWDGSGDSGSFDPDGNAQSLIDAAQGRLDQAIDDVRGDLSGMYSGVSASGSCEDYQFERNGQDINLDFCGKIETWGGTVRNAVLLVCALLSFGIIMRAND